MRIRLIAIGGRMPGWVQTAFDDYRQRLPRSVRFELVELPLGVRGSRGDPGKAIEAEGERVLRTLSDAERVIALDERGAAWTSRQLSSQLDRWQQQGRDIALVIGGPDGHAPAVSDRAEQQWSLSPLTLPHALVRVVVIEQLYRAAMLLAGHPYHRGDDP